VLAGGGGDWMVRVGNGELGEWEDGNGEGESCTFFAPCGHQGDGAGDDGEGEGELHDGWMDRTGPSGRARRGGVVRPIKRPGGVGGDVAPLLAIRDWTASWSLRVVEDEVI
jgi:hypothetical protein